jgi:hypothetical protein
VAAIARINPKGAARLIIPPLSIPAPKSPRQKQPSIHHREKEVVVFRVAPTGLSLGWIPVILTAKGKE